MDAKGGSGGGMFLKGSGETQLEEDRRLFRKQLGKIEDDLAAVQAHASAHHGALPSPHR
jgi:50S ribosomal subunit-associated GTPase HflX